MKESDDLLKDFIINKAIKILSGEVKLEITDDTKILDMYYNEFKEINDEKVKIHYKL